MPGASYATNTFVSLCRNDSILFDDSPPLSRNVPCLKPSCDTWLDVLFAISTFQVVFIAAALQTSSRITFNLISSKGTDKVPTRTGYKIIVLLCHAYRSEFLTVLPFITKSSIGKHAASVKELIKDGIFNFHVRIVATLKSTSYILVSEHCVPKL